MKVFAISLLSLTIGISSAVWAADPTVACLGDLKKSEMHAYLVDESRDKLEQEKAGLLWSIKLLQDQLKAAQAELADLKKSAEKKPE